MHHFPSLVLISKPNPLFPFSFSQSKVHEGVKVGHFDSNGEEPLTFTMGGGLITGVHYCHSIGH